MSVFTTEITNYVNTTFTAAATGFTNANRTAMIALGESFCALVDASNWEDEFDAACRGLILGSSFANLSEAKQIMMNEFAETCINWAIVYYGTGGFGANVKDFYMIGIAQASTNAPTGTIVENDITGDGAAAPVFAYDGVGDYSLLFNAGEIPVTAKVVATIFFQPSDTVGAIAMASRQIFASTGTGEDRIKIFSNTISADTGTGVITSVAANALLSKATLRVRVYMS